ncbi:MAG: acyl-CoA thioesterase II [Hyphomicrobiaceae bacterium]
MTAEPGTNGALAELVGLLDLEQLEVNLFRGLTPPGERRRVFGGQVLGQSLVAALRTIEEPRPVHSMHGYFLLAGDPKIPIIYDVERVRDGGSFTTRRVKAVQHGRAIFVMSASFQRLEIGLDHQLPMPDVPDPESLPAARDLLQRLGPMIPEELRSYLERERPVEMRLVESQRYLTRAKAAPVQHVWLRANGRLPDDPTLHQCVLAYASDYTLLDTALIAHGRLLFDSDLQMASLDHALWFHRPFRADDWLLYAQDSPSASGSRGFCRGSIFKRDGTLIASVAQEGLMRLRSSDRAPKK